MSNTGEPLDATLVKHLRTVSDQLLGVHMHTYVARCDADAYMRYAVLAGFDDTHLPPNAPVPERIKRRIIVVGVDHTVDPGFYLLVAMMATPTTCEQLREFFPGVTDWQKIDGMPPISLANVIGLN